MAAGSINRWLGGATAVAQVCHYTPTNQLVGDEFKLTVYGAAGDTEVITSGVLTGTPSVQTVVEALKTAWNLSSDTLCAGITATEDNLKVILTADVAGTPFRVVPTVVDAGAGAVATHVETISVENDSPYEAITAANWSLGTAPVDGELIVYDGSAGDDATRKYDCDWRRYNFVTGVLNAGDSRVERGYTGIISLTGDPWEVVFEYLGTKRWCILNGTSVCYIQLTTKSTYKTCQQITVLSGSVYIYSDASDNDWGDILALGGILYVADETIFDKITMLGSTTIVSIGVDCTDVSGNDCEIYVHDGAMTSDSHIGSFCKIGGGTFTWGSEAKQAGYGAVDVEADYVEVFDTGIFYWNVVANTSQVSRIKQFQLSGGGKLDTSAAVGAAGDKVVGTAGGGEESRIWSDSIFDTNNGYDNISMAGGSPAPSINVFGSGSIIKPTEYELTEL